MEGKSPSQLLKCEVRDIKSSLGAASFRFSAMHRFYIPKPNKPGQLRPITQPYPKEILVMDAISHVLNQVFADIFLECSHSFRKTYGTHTFFAHLNRWWNEIDQFLSADIVGCFENIQHQSLLETLQLHINVDQFTHFIRAFLTTNIVDKDGNNYSITGKVIPHSSSLSPVLMNIFMHQLFLQMIDYPNSLIHYARYADDFLVAIKLPERQGKTKRE